MFCLYEFIGLGYICVLLKRGEMYTTILFLILKVWHLLTQDRAFSVKLLTVMCGPNSPRSMLLEMPFKEEICLLLPNVVV